MPTLDTTILILCDWCDEILEPEEMAHVGGIDAILCYDCHALGYCEECSLCGDPVDPDEIDERYVAVMTDVDGSPRAVPAGIYEATRMPYFAQNVIGSGWLWSDSLRLIEPMEPDDDVYPPCGFLCARCVLDAMHGWGSRKESH